MAKLRTSNQATYQLLLTNYYLPIYRTLITDYSLLITSRPQTLEIHIQTREDDPCKHSSAYQAADHDCRQRSLYFRTCALRECHWQKSQ